MLCTSTNIYKFNHTLDITLHYLQGRKILAKLSPYILGLNKQLVLPVYSAGTTDGQILQRAQQTFTILSREVGCPWAAAWHRDNGMVVWRMVYLFLTRPLTLSTWILTAASPLVASGSSGCSCCLPLVNAGILNCAQNRPTVSLTLKPLSARMTSPGDSLSR